MATEIERKYLVKGDDWRSQSVRSESISQGYLTEVGSDSKVEVRVRQVDDDRAFLTIKSKGGLVRQEFEYSIPVSHAKSILELCGSHTITKIRHHVADGEYMWFVDDFCDRHLGLTVAEIELRTVHEEPRLPDWIGLEVTDDPRYRNAYLAQHSKELE